MTYLTKDEFKDFGFDEVEEVEEFEKLLKRAEIAINLFLNNFYSFVDFEKEIEHRKQAVKLATAFQVAYLDASGITTADDKQSVSTVVLVRTHITYKNSSSQPLASARYNLSIDALNTLTSAGFGFRGVGYDRH